MGNFLEDETVWHAPGGGPSVEFKDAWLQHDELLNKYTMEWEVRDDLHVVALACDRTVRFDLRHAPPKDEWGMGSWYSTQRNVGTMRELAAAIIEACDFVDASNPQWAMKAGPHTIVRDLKSDGQHIADEIKGEQ